MNAPPGTLIDNIQGHEARKVLEDRNQFIADLYKREADTKAENAGIEREIEELERM